MAVATSGWHALGEWPVCTRWAGEGELLEDLEGELDEDGEEDDMGYLAGEIRALEGELLALRAEYRTLLPLRLARRPATRDRACRRLARLGERGGELGATIAHLACEYRERWREDAAD